MLSSIPHLSVDFIERGYACRFPDYQIGNQLGFLSDNQLGLTKHLSIYLIVSKKDLILLNKHLSINPIQLKLQCKIQALIITWIYKMAFDW